MFNDEQSTVMVPAWDGISHASLLTPPTIKAETDRQQWREDISDWANNIVACAKGGDTKDKGVATCLGLTVYRSLDLSIREQIYESVRIGEIVLKPKENEKTDTQRKKLEKKSGLSRKIHQSIEEREWCAIISKSTIQAQSG